MQPANSIPIPIQCQNIMRSIWMNRLWRHRRRYWHHQKMDFRNKWMHFKYMHMVCTNGIHSFYGNCLLISLTLVQFYKMHLITVVKSDKSIVVGLCLPVQFIKSVNNTRTATSMLLTDVGDEMCWWQLWDVFWYQNSATNIQKLSPR